MSISSACRFSTRLLLGIGLTLSWFAVPAMAAEDDQMRLAREIQPLIDCLSGRYDSFVLTLDLDAKIDSTAQRIDAKLVRHSDESFDLDITHQDYAVQLRRRADATAMVLPLHKTVFVGRGETDAIDHLLPLGLTSRLMGPTTNAFTYGQILQGGDPKVAALILVGLFRLQFDPTASVWNLGKASVQFSNDGRTIDVHSGEQRLRLTVADRLAEAEPLDNWPGMKVVELDRRELERQLVRGVRRTFDILDPASSLIAPAETARKVEHGELRWIEGHRVALLNGTPEQIGKAHGELLQQEATRCIDSVLYAFGTAQTVRTGRWFRHELADAYARLETHIPERHQAETRALAASLGMDEALLQTLNVFPELFHCSGFAVFGKATADGKLYHGRVLDYMTTIGLQDAATTFIVAPQGQQAFVNVGYAGFVGSVSGMNARGISLGEMGGRGEGQWDGVPMATLMRRALEECTTLEEVKSLWTRSPRTCEYYYVFADGKTNQAVGVAATRQRIEFVEPGQTHELLGEGIEDAVVLSAGERLETLRQRVTQRHGQIDAGVAQWLMSRPVAMESNLHNVLFVPAEGVLYVANAGHQQPAAERPYVRLDFLQLLQSMSGVDVVATVAGGK
jgi:hypothetical protein